MSDYIALTDYVESYLHDPNAPVSKVKRKRAILEYQPSIDVIELEDSTRSIYIEDMIERAIDTVYGFLVLGIGIVIMVGYLWYFM